MREAPAFSNVNRLRNAMRSCMQWAENEKSNAVQTVRLTNRPIHRSPIGFPVNNVRLMAHNFAFSRPIAEEEMISVRREHIKVICRPFSEFCSQRNRDCDEIMRMQRDFIGRDGIIGGRVTQLQLAGAIRSKKKWTENFLRNLSVCFAGGNGVIAA